MDQGEMNIPRAGQARPCDVVLFVFVPVFNCPIRRLGIPSLYLDLLFFAMLVVLVVPGISRAQSLADGARMLARKTVSAAHGASVSFEQRNLSSLKDGDFTALVAVFLDEMQKHGVKISTSNEGAKLTFTVSGNVTSYLGVAKIERGGAEEIVFEQLGHGMDVMSGEPGPGVVLHREFLMALDTPMLDVSVGEDKKHATVLGQSEITRMELKNDRWEALRREHLSRQAGTYRDMRGSLFYFIDVGFAYFTGETCTNSLNSGLGWRCESSRRDVIPIYLPQLGEGRTIVPWFSAAPFEQDGRSKLIFTGKDGAARLYEADAEPVVVSRNWGSEIASIHSGCGAGWQVLITSKGDWTTTDTVQAMEMQNGIPREISAQMEMAGPVMALHAAPPRLTENIPEDKGVTAIIRNLQSGKYEAYRLTIRCGN
jgi:hypothetical protein